MLNSPVWISRNISGLLFVTYYYMHWENGSLRADGPGFVYVLSSFPRKPVGKFLLISTSIFNHNIPFLSVLRQYSPFNTESLISLPR